MEWSGMRCCVKPSFIVVPNLVVSLELSGEGEGERARRHIEWRMKYAL